MACEITVFGGANEIGGNQIRVADQGASLWLDFGCPMSRRERFYDAFGGPRATLGVRDLIALGLAPSVPGLYRTDLIPPGFDLSGVLESPVAVLLSHCHLDHAGYISLFDPGIPVYSTVLTALLAKATQDSAPDDMETEVTYAIQREDRQGLLAATHYKKSPARLRRWVAFGDESPGLDNFWGTVPGARGVEGPPIERLPAGSEASIGPFKVRNYPVDHSVLGASAWAVKTSAGWIAYTGDLRLHGNRPGDTFRALEALRELRPTALIVEGTHPGEAWPSAEAAVGANALSALTVWSGAIIVDYGSRNLERLRAFEQVSRQLGRRLAVSPRDWYLMQAARLGGAIDLRESDVCLYASYAKINRPTWERITIERFTGEQLTARAAARRLPEFLLGLGFYDLQELIDLPAAGGVYLRSVSEAWNEEEVVNQERLLNWLRQFGVRYLGAGPREGAAFHASGHVDGHGIRHVVEAIGPGCVVPVHTEKASAVKKLLVGRKVIVPSYGKAIPL
ncbi:MAG: hypothetical protein Q8P50_14825 [Bacillota bacterium]|nr:hypothetical protein [Bacillota bacterium]